jgi:peptidoglycan/xylan/chitin deacetylase (PgdA/CDA1 family)
MKNKVRNLIVILSSLITRFFVPKNSCRIVALHEIRPDQKDEFKQKLIWLRKNFPNVRLTFDDGFKCFYTVIFPVLRDLNFPATFFISSGALGLEGVNAHKFIKENLRRTSYIDDFITEDELKEMSDYQDEQGKNLITIGGHTKNHIDCGKSYSEEEWEREIIDDKRKLEEIIEREIVEFACPFGAKVNTSSKAQEIIARAGYKRAYSIVPGFTNLGVWNQKTLNPQGNFDQFWTSRDSLTLNESDTVWRAWLLGGYDWVVKLKDKIK